MGKHIIWVPLAILATLLAVLLWLGFQAHPQDTPESSPETTAALQEDQAAPPDPTDWRLMLVERHSPGISAGTGDGGKRLPGGPALRQ